MGPQGAHARLQQAPPQRGSPPPSYAVFPPGAVPPHSCPSASLQFVGPDGGESAHVPSVPPSAMVHVPVQQSAFAEQASPGWPQKEDAWQVPLAHLAEQHSESDAQALPIVLHDPLSGAHFPLTQF